MVSQTALFNHESSSFQIPYSLMNNQLWFKAKDVATALGYANTQQAIRVNVDDDDRKNWENWNHSYQIAVWTPIKNSMCISMNQVCIASY